MKIAIPSIQTQLIIFKKLIYLIKINVKGLYLQQKQKKMKQKLMKKKLMKIKLLKIKRMKKMNRGKKMMQIKK